MQTLSKNISYFARVDYRNDERLFGILQKDRISGMYLLGKSNNGKSNALKTLFYQDVLHNRGACLYDCHGDLFTEILNIIPEHRKKDVVVLDATNQNITLGYNPLRKVSYQKRALVASSILETFKKLWGQQGWGVKLEYILRQVLLTILDAPYGNFGDIPKVLLDDTYRNQYFLPHIVSKHVKRFWELEFPKLSSKSDILPVLNKVSGFLSIPMIHKILVENKTQLSLRSVMDKQQILLINLSKGSLGSDGVHLLGSLLLNSFFSAGYTREDTLVEQRKPYYLYLDEFQNYTSESIAAAISELRKYQIGFVLAHQYGSQISLKIRDAIMGNIGTVICFKLSQVDAKYMEREFSGIFTASDFINVPQFHILLRLLIQGTISEGFSAKTIQISELYAKWGG